MVNLKDVEFAAEYLQYTLGKDRRYINILLFGCDSIISRLREGKAFGLAPRTKIRSAVETANKCIRHWSELVNTLIIVTGRMRLVCCRSHAIVIGCVNDLRMGCCSSSLA